MPGRPKARKEEEQYKTVKYHSSAICKRLGGLIHEGNQKELCEKLGITDRTIYHWKKGQARPDIDKLAALANFFGVTVDYLVGRTDIACPDTSSTAICARTGLTEEAVSTLTALRESLPPDEEIPLHEAEAVLAQRWFINALLENREALFRIASSITTYRHLEREVKDSRSMEDAKNAKANEAVADFGYEKLGLTFLYTTGEDSLRVARIWCQQAVMDFIEHVLMPKKKSAKA